MKISILKLLGQTGTVLFISSVTHASPLLSCLSLFRNEPLRISQETSKSIDSALKTIGDLRENDETKVRAIQSIHRANRPFSSKSEITFLNKVLPLFRPLTKYELIEKALRTEDNEWLRVAAIEQLIKISEGGLQEKMELLHIALQDTSREVQAAAMEVFNKLNSRILTKEVLDLLRDGELRFDPSYRMKPPTKVVGSKMPENFVSDQKRPNLSDFEDINNPRKRYAFMLFRMRGSLTNEIFNFFVNKNWQNSASSFYRRNGDVDTFISAMPKEHLAEDLLAIMNLTRNKHYLDFQNEVLEKINNRFLIERTPTFMKALEKYVTGFQTEEGYPEFRNYHQPKTLKERTIARLINQETFSESDLKLLSLAYLDRDMRPIIRESLKQVFFMSPPISWPKNFPRSSYNFGNDLALDRLILRHFPLPIKNSQNEYTLDYVFEYNLKHVAARTAFIEDNNPKTAEIIFDPPNEGYLSYWGSSEKIESFINYEDAATWLIQAKDRGVRMEMAQYILSYINGNRLPGSTAINLIRLGLYSNDRNVRTLFEKNLKPELLESAGYAVHKP